MSWKKVKIKNTKNIEKNIIKKKKLLIFLRKRWGKLRENAFLGWCLDLTQIILISFFFWVFRKENKINEDEGKERKEKKKKILLWLKVLNKCKGWIKPC